MKHILKSLVVFALVFSATNCGKKKETDKYGNVVEENVTLTTETNADPLLAKGKELFEGKGTCTACHKPASKVIGPSIKEIAKIYKEKGASIATFINEKGEPIVDPSQYEIMKTNFAITKAMTAEERKALEVYIMSFQ